MSAKFKPLLAPLAIAAIISGCAPTPRVVISNGGSQISIDRSITVASGQPTKLAFQVALNPDCSQIQPGTVTREAQAPAHGRLEFRKTEDFTNFPASNPRSQCNSRRVQGVAIYYHPDKGFTGSDAFAYDLFTNTGGQIRSNVTANVR